MTLLEYLTDECGKLFRESEDFKDAMLYLDDVISDAHDEFPDMVVDDIEIEAIRIMKSFYESPGETPIAFGSLDDGPD